MANIVALLDSMWAWGGYNDADSEADRWFRINPDNASGRRLYSLVGSHSLLVTNSCRYVQRSAQHHGSPDPRWVRSNLVQLRKDGWLDLLLVCGRIARYTYDQAIRLTDVPPPLFLPVWDTIFIDHPAARRWSHDKIKSVAEEIDRKCRASS